jgi:DHA3 family macrolide efflux protein-like MFS transporter
VWGGFKRRIYTSLTGLILQGLTITLLGVTPSTAFWMAVANWGLGAFMNVLYNGPVAALLQAVVPPDIQGRVFTAMQSIVWIAWPLSLAIAGPVADWAGIRTWYVVGGAVCMILGIGALFIPAIANLEQEAGARAGRQTDAFTVA